MELDEAGRVGWLMLMRDGVDRFAAMRQRNLNTTAVFLYEAGAKIGLPQDVMKAWMTQLLAWRAGLS